jgi:Flp pilus assembly protein TadB
MAQTKRKRRSKHRGNAAGVIETRSRTSSNRTACGSAKQTAAQRRGHRLDQEPTWRGAANRAAVITVVAIALFTLVLKAPFGQMFVIAVPMFLAYTAFNFYCDRFIYRRRQAKKAAGKA